jgi:hypothetical protein
MLSQVSRFQSLTAATTAWAKCGFVSAGLRALSKPSTQRSIPNGSSSCSHIVS